MSNYKFIFLSVFILPIVFHFNAYTQDADIITYLKQIEDGNKDQVAGKLETLKTKYPDSPSIMFLEGVLTDDGEKAISIYKDLVKKYPQSKYADASLYRICTYYFAVGKYSDVKSNFKKLKKYYPQSPYIKLTERDIPDEDVTDEKEVNENDKTASDIAVKPADSKSYKYTIQAGAFTIADNAKSLKSDLENAGYFTTIEDKTVGGASFHIIYVGKFVNQEDAKSFLQKLDKKYNLNGRVVSINSK